MSRRVGCILRAEGRVRPMGLETYEAKRNFDRTPEPVGGQGGIGGVRSFVVQEHHARRLHYDLRLELDGVLKSWAVPKGPSLDPGQTVLAVQVEDHPLDYRTFEGVIPPGQYGSGTVMLWDEGQWEPAGNPQQGLRRGKLKFTLHGERLRGDWLLVRMKPSDDSKTHWLLRKLDDAAAHRTVDVVAEYKTSVRSGRSIDQIAEHEPRPKPRGRRRRSSVKGQVVSPRIPEARESEMPREVRPQLATPADTAPSGDEWLHEIKFDGYRILGYVERRKVRLLTRGGHDWTERFQEIAAALEQVQVAGAILDGEVVAETADGRVSFQQLQNHLRARGRATLVFYVFDLLYLDGFDLRRSPLVERKKALEAILQGLPDAAGRRVRFSDHIRGDGPRVIQEACRRGLEGVISKRATSRYTQRRTRDWLKAKCTQRQEFVIVGYTDPGGARVGFGSLMLATREGGEWCYRGNVGTGFDDRLLRELHQQLQGLGCAKAPVEIVSATRSRGVHWVRPELVAEVQFAEWTADGHLRHPVFLGIREDKVPKEISRELPRPVAQVTASKAATKGKAAVPRGRGKGKVTVGGVVLTHPERELYPEQGVTKRHLAEYYLEVADRMLPHVAHRPLALLRCPEGRAGKCFFQKHATASLPDVIQLVNVAEEGEEAAPHLQIADAAGLVALAQLGVLEIHIWGSRSDRVERPDRMVLDLDPDPGVDYAAVIDAAREVRRVLEVLGLESFVMLTGGKGIHVVAPLQRHHGWEEIKPFARSIAQFMERLDPKRYISVMSKSRRKGKIFVDYLRNGRGATAIAPYSTRARPGAPVAVPVTWEELAVDRAPNHYTLENVRPRLAGLSQEPWAGFNAARSRVTRRRHDELNHILKG
jgi:bifunctional non-homologous end joining protein LigD